MTSKLQNQTHKGMLISGLEFFRLFPGLKDIIGAFKYTPRVFFLILINLLVVFFLKKICTFSM